MSLQAHIGMLYARHEKLDKELEKEQKDKKPDQGRITDIKKKKLQVKDEIRRLAPDMVA